MLKQTQRGRPCLLYARAASLNLLCSDRRLDAEGCPEGAQVLVGKLGDGMYRR